MKIKTSELTGAALDWAVAKCEGVNEETFRLFYYPTEPTDFDSHGYPEFHYSDVWAQGGPLIEREDLTVGKVVGSKNEWSAESFQDDGVRVKFLRYGPTPLIAAMRCYVASKLGDEVDVPEEIT